MIRVDRFKKGALLFFISLFSLFSASCHLPFGNLYHMMRGESALEKEDFKEAIDEFNKVLQQDPSNEAAKERLAISHKKMKTHRENVVRGLVQMNNAGFVMYQRQEYVKAGQSWRDVIHRYESQNDPELQRELPFKIHEVKGTLHQ